jgi:formylglycine-generating enzyme required for sulfatase activity
LVVLASNAAAQSPAPAPVPSAFLGLSKDFWEKAILVVLTAAVTLLSTKVVPWLWQWLGRLYDLLIGAVGWDPFGRFQRRYLAALRREHGYLKLIGVRTEGVNPPKLEEVYVSLRMVPPRISATDQTDSPPERVMGVGVALRGFARLVILGAPGAGKTTLLEYLALGFGDGLPKERRQELPLGRLLPIFVPLRRCAAGDKTLLEALTDPSLKLLPPDLLRDCPSDYFWKRLEKGRCLVLLDGLDEVASEVQYHAAVSKINSLVTAYPRNLYLVTCRKAGWRGGLAGDFTALEIQDFRPADVERFVRGWYQAVLPERELRTFKGTREERQVALKRAYQKASGKADELIGILKERERLGWLAANPMMLCLIAFVHYTRGDLPRGRVALYRQCLEILLELWDKRDKELRLESAPTLAQKEAVLRQIAYDFHVGGRREASRAELEAIIARLIPGLGCSITAPEFLRQIEERSGLLTERAIDVLAFSHLTFQEYLTARVFLGDETMRPELLAHHADPDWREVLLLFSGMLPQATDWLKSLWHAEGAPPLLTGRCMAEAVHAAPEIREAVLAALNATFRSDCAPALLWETGEVLAEVSGRETVEYFLAALTDPGFEVRRVALRALGQPKQSLAPQVIQDILSLAQKDERADVRATALEVLGQLNLRVPVPGLAEILPPMLCDSHSDVRAAAAAALDTVLVEVPAGPFRMGSDKPSGFVKESRFSLKTVSRILISPRRGERFLDLRWFLSRLREPKAYKDEMPQHTVITQAYRISTYPVTNAQFERFVAAGGYGNRAYWTPAGWRWKGYRHGSEHYGGRFERPDLPVVGASWYEAVAYCRWLTDTTGQPYRLPTEAEWEKAARGTDSRAWPWGDGFDPARCNTSESGRGGTTPVTQFPGERSPYGCYDMAGNVWEWTSSLYKPYPYRADDGREDPNAEGSRVIRGGSWRFPRVGARCAGRNVSRPDDRLGSLGFRCCSRSPG